MFVTMLVNPQEDLDAIYGRIHVNAGTYPSVMPSVNNVGGGFKANDDKVAFCFPVSVNQELPLSGLPVFLDRLCLKYPDDFSISVMSTGGGGLGGVYRYDDIMARMKENFMEFTPLCTSYISAEVMTALVTGEFIVKEKRRVLKGEPPENRPHTLVYLPMSFGGVLMTVQLTRHDIEISLLLPGTDGLYEDHETLSLIRSSHTHYRPHAGLASDLNRRHDLHTRILIELNKDEDIDVVGKYLVTTARVGNPVKWVGKKGYLQFDHYADPETTYRGKATERLRAYTEKVLLGILEAIPTGVTHHGAVAVHVNWFGGDIETFLLGDDGKMRMVE